MKIVFFDYCGLILIVRSTQNKLKTPFRTEHVPTKE